MEERDPDERNNRRLADKTDEPGDPGGVDAGVCLPNHRFLLVAATGTVINEWMI